MPKLTPSTTSCRIDDLIKQTHVAGMKAVILYPYMQISCGSVRLTRTTGIFPPNSFTRSAIRYGLTKETP